MEIKILVVFILNLVLSEIEAYANLEVNIGRPPIDPSFYEDVLDPELCQEQLSYIRNNSLLRMQFLESGMRIPKGILVGNTIDLGNYMQCLSIDHNFITTNIEGKYCSINVPLNQSFHLPPLPGLPEWPDRPDWIPEWIPESNNISKWIDEVPKWVNFDPRGLLLDVDTLRNVQKYKTLRHGLQVLNGELDESRNALLLPEFTLAVCVPKSCTTREGINGLLFNLTEFGFEYSENYCRLNNDKPWAPVDYIVIIIFTLLGLITAISTGYDIWITFIVKSDPKSINTLYRSFSLHTNYRRLTTFTSNPGSLECLDGIRTISMAWIVLGHTFSTLPALVNMVDGFNWSNSMKSLWITSAPLAVDTFFMISGLLLVYSAAGKLTGEKLVKTLHLFYLNRLLRMFPILATGILLQASFLHHVSDGPVWEGISHMTQDCRNNWWSTLIYLQNYLNTDNMCLNHTWYLAIDMQLHFLSPLVLFWVLSGSKKKGWISIVTALLCVFAASSVYICIMAFPASASSPARADQFRYYMRYFYVNTLTRASPFLIGMLFGFLLHLSRGKEIVLSKVTVAIFWLTSAALMLLVVFAYQPLNSIDHDNQAYDNLLNILAKPCWAAGVAIVIFTCVHGYGGPINWLLTLQVWKLLSRLSYAMYIFHYPFMIVTSASSMQPHFFTVIGTVYKFLSEFAIAFLISFGMTLLVDSPFSTLFKMMLSESSGTKAKNEDSHKKRENNDVAASKI